MHTWSNLPYADEFIEEFGEHNGFSFAFMNLSKFSNESGNWVADEELIDSFIRLSENPTHNFFGEEIKMLNPDIIIGMNLGDRMKVLGSFERPHYYGNNNDVCFQQLVIGEDTYTYLDTWHFSSPKKSPERDIFNPVIAALKAHNII